jgi:hypothetical protein
MTTQTVSEKQWQHIGESQGCANHDHDLVHELSRRLDSLWRYDQFIANADGHPAVQACWRDLRKQEIVSVQRLKSLITQEINDGCF